MTFFVLSLFLRFIQGFGNACVSISSKSDSCSFSGNIGLSIVTSEFPDRREQVFGYTESAIGFGLMMGPAIGQILYSLVGFENCFYCTGLILCIPMIITYFYVPSRLNKPQRDQDRKGSSASSNTYHG